MDMISLQAGEAAAVIEPALGGRLASLRIGARELLVGPAFAGDRSITWGCFLMAPWPGRLDGGRFEWRGRTIQLPRTHGRHAIHGLVWDRPWTVVSASSTAAVIACELPRDEWPMGGIVRQSFALRPDGLAIDASIRAGESMPAALGWHPWFLRRGGASLRVDADEVLELRHMLPTGRAIPVAGRFDLRAGPDLGRRRLDDVYLGARPPIEIRWPDLALRLETDPWLSTVVVYTPPGAICVEPQTALPNALGLGASMGLAAGAFELAAGSSLRASLTFGWKPGS